MATRWRRSVALPLIALQVLTTLKCVFLVREPVLLLARLILAVALVLHPLPEGRKRTLQFGLAKFAASVSVEVRNHHLGKLPDRRHVLVSVLILRSLIPQLLLILVVVVEVPLIHAWWRSSALASRLHPLRVGSRNETENCDDG